MTSSPEPFDVVIIGAGFSGLYAVHKLSQTHKVICLEAGDGVGGTWYWNRYPGARVDIKSVEYSYGFDEDLQQEWQWPEVFSAQPDLERYANHVADRFDLRKDIRLSTTVTSLKFDASTDRWHVQTADGGRLVCQHIIAATGALSAPNTPDWPGREDFQGEIYHTSRWPEEPLDLSDKRVGIIGTGSTAIQAAPILAEQCKHLTVFQRTPAYSIPAPPVEIAERQVVTIDSEGAPIPAWLYHPRPGSLFPLTVFFHGGGWVHGTLETHDRLAATLANEAQCAVLSVDYRLAPEHPFPAAYQDAIAAVAWAKANAARLGCDAGRIALAGDSAGGNLAAAAARSLAGDPALCHQLLFYPALDAICAAKSFEAEHPGFLTSAQMRWYWDQYAASGNRRELADNPHASPAAGAVSPDTPKATIVVPGNDPLHDEGASYADKLRAAGVPATLLSYPGAIHGFASMIGMVPLADEAVSAAAAALRDSFGE